ncbi:squalene--hopene cyclase [Jatrophihabitans sp. DSM 45814]
MDQAPDYEAVFENDIDGPAVRRAAEAAADYLLSRQDEAGFWRGELRTNVTMDAEDLLLRAFLGILHPADLDAGARWIRSQQNVDGGWSTFEGGPNDLSTTIEAYVALRLAGDSLDAPHLSVARELILELGGIESSRVFTRIWLALFGEWSWDELPVIPPEMIRIPKWAPLNVYDWGCWARQTIVALAVVSSQRPVAELGFTVSELRTNLVPAELRPRRAWTIARGFQHLDRLLHRYERLAIKPGRNSALRACTEWIVARQESDGGWGGIQPPWVYSILALRLMGYPLDHPVLRAAIEGLEGFLVREQTPDGPVRRLEACQSPVWDTCLTVIALLDAGLPTKHPAVQKAAQWLLDEQVRVPGDWSVRRPELAPGGWSFEFANDIYPDVDDTAEVVLALDRVIGGSASAEGSDGVEGAIQLGVDWLIGMQSSDGGWGAFDADNTATLAADLPFSDFGNLSDPPSADVTAHAVEMLCARGYLDAPATGRGVRWLLAAQEPDGSWYGRWGANYVYGTGAVVPALIAAGVPTYAVEIERAVEWLHAHQNDDGGWGEDLRSYVDGSWSGRGESTASQTAWALLALLAAADTSASVERGVQFLLDSQQADGGWLETRYTGTGFPGFFYINYEMYRHVFPLSALGRYANRLDGEMSTVRQIR